jgi:hypothetical protein
MTFTLKEIINNFKDKKDKTILKLSNRHVTLELEKPHDTIVTYHRWIAWIIFYVPNNEVIIILLESALAAPFKETEGHRTIK